MDAMHEMRLIDANAVSKTLRNLPFGYTKSFAGQAAIKEIENAPTIDAVPVVHGQWVETGKVFVHSMYDLFTKCSLCSFRHVRNEYQEPYRYCPNCGAKMDAKEDVPCA